jgi:hypothetical protein
LVVEDVASLLPKRFPKSKFVPLHIDTRPAKSNALHAQPESLFRTIFGAELNGAARPDYAVPWQSGNLLEDAHNLASGPRPACGFGNRAIA